MVDSARNGRWAGFVGVLIIAILSWSTGRLNRRSDKTLINLGDQRLIAEGMGPTLADLIRRPPSPITNGATAQHSGVGTPGRADGGIESPVAYREHRPLVNSGVLIECGCVEGESDRERGWLLSAR